MKIDDETKYLLLLNSLPIFVEHFKDMILYGKDFTNILYEVQTTVRSNELSIMKNLKVNDNGESLSVSRRESKNRWKSKFKGFDKSMLKCFIFIKLVTSRKIVSRQITMKIMYRLQIPRMRMIMRVLRH